MNSPICDRPFQFQAEPRLIPSTSKLPAGFSHLQVPVYSNVMTDSRIVRGNTNSLYFRRKYDPSYELAVNQRCSVQSQQPPIDGFGESKRLSISRKEGLSRQMQDKHNSNHFNNFSSGKNDPHSINNDPFDLSGQTKSGMANNSRNESKKRRFIQQTQGNRVNREVWVENSVRFQTDIPQSRAQEVQTDPVEPKPLHIKDYLFNYGIDACTQVNLDKVFKFHIEVQPLATSLCSRIIAESLQEVNQERELFQMEGMQNKVKSINSMRASELGKFRAEKIEQKLEKEKYLSREKKSKEANVKIHQQLVSRTFAKHFLKELSNEGFDLLPLSAILTSDKAIDLQSKLYELLHEEVEYELKIRNSLDRLWESQTHQVVQRIYEDFIQR